MSPLETPAIVHSGIPAFAGMTNQNPPFIAENSRPNMPFAALRMTGASMSRIAARPLVYLPALDPPVFGARGAPPRAVKAFEPLGVAPLNPESAGDVIADVVRAEWDRA